jgi:hypothetical protein
MRGHSQLADSVRFAMLSRSLWRQALAVPHRKKASQRGTESFDSNSSLLQQILQRRGRHIDKVLLAITGTRSPAHAEDKGVKTLGCLTLIQSGPHLAHGLGLSENPLEG